jgi:hypothetical protein
VRAAEVKVWKLCPFQIGVNSSTLVLKPSYYSARKSNILPQLCLLHKVQCPLIKKLLRPTAFIYTFPFSYFWLHKSPLPSSVSAVSDYGLDGRSSIPDRGRGFFL